MIKKLLSVAAVATVALTGIGAAPASAQDYYGRDSHREHYGRDDRGGYRDGENQNDREENYRERGGYRYQHQHRDGRYSRYAQSDQYRQYSNGGYPQPQYRQRRCTSGTTGTIVGAVLGGLLGREVGRGGPYNAPSTTGAIIGAGGGALAGRAIERNGCR